MFKRSSKRAPFMLKTRERAKRGVYREQAKKKRDRQCPAAVGGGMGPVAGQQKRYQGSYQGSYEYLH